MSLTKHIAKHLRDIHFGGNWTTSNLKGNLTDLTWQQATTKIMNFNTIAMLTYHTTYYVTVLLNVLKGEPLNSKDEYSFNLPPIQSQPDWEQLLEKAWTDAENAARLIEQLPDDKLEEFFVDEKYGNYFRNIMGTVEHMHYHLGQIALIKKILLKTDKN